MARRPRKSAQEPPHIPRNGTIISEMSTEEEENQLEFGETASEEAAPKKTTARKAAKKAAKKRAKKATEPTAEKPVISADDDEVTFAAGIVVEADEPKAPNQEAAKPEPKENNESPSPAGVQNGEGKREGQHPRNKQGVQQHDQNRNKNHFKKNNKRNRNKNNKNKRWQNNKQKRNREEESPLDLGELLDWELLDELESIKEIATDLSSSAEEPLDYNRFYDMGLTELRGEAAALDIEMEQHAPNRNQLIDAIAKQASDAKTSILSTGILELLEDDEGGILVYERDNYRIKALSAFVPQVFIDHYGLKRGHIVQAQIHPHRETETCPFVVSIVRVMDRDPDTLSEIVPFTERVPYYPTSRILMESETEGKWDNLSMRVVDCLTPVGFGQRGLIVAPPRTGKTVLMQGMANSIQKNYPDAHLIILLIDERPEEVTDFRRQVHGEVVSSTFDESAESHVHAAEMVIEKARRMVETGQDVVILLDSITRLARAYNTTMPNSGKILSGGVEANALQKPKRFFGSARNIEDGGSLTIIATALVETGSKMDEVIFEEFKGTGNMELHLDRGLSDKRIFPALSMDKSGTRKEELLYHPDEMQKIYSLRRAMKGLPSTDAMEMLIQRIKKTNTNAEFLMSVAR